MTSDARLGIRSDSKQAEQSINSVRGLFKSLGEDAKKSILTGVGLGAGVSAFAVLKGAIGGVTDFLGDAVREAVNDEESVNRLTASLKANVPAWDGSTKAIERQIEKAQRLGFADEELRNSITVLTGATHDVSKAQDIASIAMDLARFKGIDLQTASEALIKVEGGHYRMLAQLGIKLKEGATQTEALAAVQAVAAGQAEAFAKTTSGAAQAAGIAFKEFKEDLGRELMPVVRDLAVFARDEFVPALKKAEPVLKDIGGAAVELGKVAVPFLAVALGVKLVNALKAVRLAAYGALGPLGLIIAAGVSLGEENKKAANSAAEMAVKMKYGAAAAKVFADALEEAGGDGQKAMDALNAYLKGQFVPDFVESGKVAAMGLRDGLVGNAPVVAGAARTTFASIVREVNNAKAAAVTEAGTIPQAMADELLKKQQELADPIHQLLTFIKASLSPAQVIARDKAFLASKALAEGLASNDPLVVQKSQELRDKALAEISDEKAFLAGGKAGGTAWATGIAQGIASASGAILHQAYLLKANLMGHSPPPRGPLKDIDKGGFNVGKAWAGGFSKAIGGVRIPRLVGGLAGGGGAGGMAMAAASGGGPRVIQLVVGSRVLAEAVLTEESYRRPTPGLLPR